MYLCRGNPQVLINFEIFCFFFHLVYMYLFYNAAFHKDSFLQGYPVLSPYQNLSSRLTLLLVSCLCPFCTHAVCVYYIYKYMKLKMYQLEEICNILSLFWHIFPVMISTLYIF